MGTQVKLADILAGRIKVQHTVPHGKVNHSFPVDGQGGKGCHGSSVEDMAGLCMTRALSLQRSVRRQSDLLGFFLQMKKDGNPQDDQQPFPSTPKATRQSTSAFASAIMDCGTE